MKSNESENISNRVQTEEIHVKKNGMVHEAATVESTEAGSGTAGPDGDALVHRGTQPSARAGLAHAGDRCPYAVHHGPQSVGWSIGPVDRFTHSSGSFLYDLMAQK